MNQKTAMKAHKPQQDHPSDDIDLINLLERMILFLRRYRTVFIIAIIVGVLLGVLGYSLSPNLYKSRIILHSTYLTNSEQIQVVYYWNELLKRGEYKVLAQTFNCTETVLHNLASLKATEIQKVYTPENPNGFYIDATVKNNSVLEELQKAIVYGLNNTEYVKQKLAVRKETLKQLINKVKIEIGKLDSIKTNIENIISNKEKNSSSFILDVTGVNRQLIDMNEKLLSYQEELRFASGVQVLQGFVPLNTPVGISLKVMVVLGLILCLAFAYIFTLFSYVRERLKKRVISND
jgi:hypothetical protein